MRSPEPEPFLIGLSGTVHPSNRGDVERVLEETFKKLEPFGVVLGSMVARYGAEIDRIKSNRSAPAPGAGRTYPRRIGKTVSARVPCQFCDRKTLLPVGRTVCDSCAEIP